MPKIIIHHIPVCPFSQRLEILLALKGCRDAVEFRVVDITKPRPPELQALSGGSTALPLAVAPDGTVLRESLVILRWLDATLGPRIAAPEPLAHAVEDLFATLCAPFTDAGYRLVMNQDLERRAALHDALLARYAEIDAFLVRHPVVAASGWALAVFTPMFVRFAFLDWYEAFVLPAEPRFARVRAWREACLTHPAAQQVSAEEVVKLYADYALGFGNGALPPGRTRSSFAFDPHWRHRPWPPRDKYGAAWSDAELGLA